MESIDFAGRLSIASTPSGFVAVLGQQPEFHALVEAVNEDFEMKSTLVSRIDSLSRQSVDIRYLNPWDTALASYVYALKVTDPNVANVAACVVHEAPNILWARRAADSAILGSQDPTADEDTLIFSTITTRHEKIDLKTKSKEALFAARPPRLHGLSGIVTYIGSTKGESHEVNKSSSLLDSADVTLYGQ
jgi:hypothetical protein